jgi:uncharacterized protein (DUF1778 family)
MKMATLHNELKQEKLNMRINHEEKELIDRAAKILGKNRSDFILGAARREAQEIILEQTMIKVSAEAHTEFLRRLDEPPKINKRLQKTMQTQAPWDKE